MPEAFLTSDAVLVLLENVFSGLVVHADVARRRLGAEAPFLATENVLMEAVRRGADRQEVRERLRIHAREAAERRASAGVLPDLLERIAAVPAFDAHRGRGSQTQRDPEHLVGRAAEQVEVFVREELDPALQHLEAAAPPFP